MYLLGDGRPLTYIPHRIVWDRIKTEHAILYGEHRIWREQPDFGKVLRD
jgi:hypothetical protein